MIESNDTSETLYFYIQEIKENNEAQEKALEKQKFVINTAKLYDNLLNRYTTQYDNISKGLKKRLNVLNRPEKLILDFDEDDLSQKGDEEVRLEPEETISENEILKKRKITGTVLKILTPNKLLTRLPTLLAQVRTGKNSNSNSKFKKSFVSSK